MKLKCCLLLAGLLICQPVLAVTLKVATVYPDGTYTLKRYRQAAEAIRSRSDGDLRLKLYPGGVMGDDSTVKRKIRIGQLQGMMVPLTTVSDAYPDAQIYTSLLLFRNYDEVDFLRRQLDPVIEEGLEKNGWQVFGILEAGFAYLMSTRPVRSLDDLRQQKFWVPAGEPLPEKLTRAFGISPVPLGYGEVNTALETGTVNSLAAPPVAALSFFWYPRLHYMTDLPFMYTSAGFMVNKRSWERLSDKNREIMSEELRKAASDINQHVRSGSRQALAVLQERGVKPVSPDPQALKQMESQAEQAADMLVREHELSAGMYQRARTLLQSYRRDQATAAPVVAP